MRRRMPELQITSSITDRETPALERYFRDVARVTMLSPEEEVLLARKVRQGDRAAAERLVVTNLRFVISVAKKYQHMGMPLADLISEGNLGLIEAARRFDETRGFKFISFAVWWVRQRMMQALSETRRVVRLPLSQQNLLSKVLDGAEALEMRLERKPSDVELAEFIGIELSLIDDVHYYSAKTANLDEPGDDDFSLLDKTANGDAPLDMGLMMDSDRQEVAELLGWLDERERLIIGMSFGFVKEWDMSPEEIGPQLGLSAERVRQLRREAMGKLRDWAGGRVPVPVSAGEGELVMEDGV